MKAYRLFLPLLVGCFALPGAIAQIHIVPGDDASGHAAVMGDDEKYVATLQGRAGMAIAGRDKVELVRGTVYVNGKSWGKVPEPCQVRLEVTKNGLALFIDGQPRQPPAANG